MIENIENRIQGLYLQECSLKNRSFFKLVISVEASFFDVTVFKRDYLHASMDILFYIMFYRINTMKKH